jgi:hypothetical protein
VSDDADSAAQSKASTTRAGIAASLISTPVAIFPVAALGLIVAGLLLRVVMKISAARRQRITIDRHDFDWGDDRPEHDLHEDQIVHRGDGLANYLQRSDKPTTTDSRPRRLSRVGNDWPNITRAGDSVSYNTNKISVREHRRIDDRRQHGWNDDQQQHETVSIDLREPGWIDDQPQHEGRNNQQQHKSVGEADELIDDLQSSLIAAASEYRPRPLQADDGWSNNGRGKDDASLVSDQIGEHEEVLERLRRDLDRLLQSPKVA